MQWFRWYHGTCADPKLGSIARKCGTTRERVIATWALILEAASEAAERGSYITESLLHMNEVAASIADVLNCKTSSIETILDEMITRGMLSDGRVTKWGVRQPDRDNVAERVRRHRKRVTETPGNGYSNHETRSGNVTDTDTEKETEEETAVTDAVANATDAGRRWLKSPISGEQPAEPEPTRGELIAKARKHGFNADGTDADIIDILIRKGVRKKNIAIGIEGLALLVESGGYPKPDEGLLSMRMLYSNKHGKQLPVWTRAEDAYWKADEKKKPVTLAHL